MSILEADNAPSKGPGAPERFKVIVIGAGQAGLSLGYHLAKRKVPFVILDADARVGEVWRRRWDSLRLFTPAQLCGLDGMRFPAPVGSFPSKDAMADYLEAYARRFKLPVRNGVKVDGVSRRGRIYRVSAGAKSFEAEHLVVAMANYQQPIIPAFASDLDPGIVQLHSGQYRNPVQIRDGAVVIVGAGNSGAEIALELARGHKTWLAGDAVGEVPFRIGGFFGRHLQMRLVLRLVFHRLMTLDTPFGRKMRARHGATPLIRTKARDLKAAGVERTGKIVGVRQGLPLLADGRTLQAANVIWCTGFQSDVSWLDLPVFDQAGEPRQFRGVSPDEPGLYFVGRHFLYALSSSMIHGVGRDAAYVAETIAQRVNANVAA